MPKVARFSLTQVSPGRFCIRHTSTEFRPGQSGREVWVIRVEDIPAGIPAGIPAEDIARRLSRLVDAYDPPSVVAWSELGAV